MKLSLVCFWLMASALAGCGGGGNDGSGGGSDGSDGSGERWVNTTSGTCDDSQIEEIKQNPEPYVAVGTTTCQGNGAGAFAGEFRCAGSEEDGTRTLQAKCSGAS